MIEFRRTGDYTHLPPPQTDQPQYFPRDVPGWPPTTPLRFVDCGAYDGDTLTALANIGIPVEAIAAFEPDLANVRYLAERAWAYRSMPPEGIILWPCAVSARTEPAAFSTGHREASHLCNVGQAVISCVALYDALPGFRPNFIKMDIEGAELDALQGAHRLITTHRPGLAICVYHRPNHLWEIPRMLNCWQLSYRLYLRAHAHNGFDLVLYGVPA